MSALFPLATSKPLRWPALLAACLALVACSQPVNPTPELPRPAAPEVPLRVLVVDDDALAKAVELQWRARAETKIEVRQASASQIAAAKRLDADAVIYPSGMLGELAEGGLISPIPKDVLHHPQLARSDIFELIRLGECMWGESVLAVPFGSPQLTLCYRADLFERLGLSPPESWAEYQSLAERLCRRDELGDLAPAPGARWRGAVEPLGPGWACHVLLTRAAGYAHHRSQYSALFNFNTMAPLVQGPPFVRALEELVAAARTPGPEPAQELSRYSPWDAHRELLAGRCAMALTWPTHAQTETEAAGAATLAATAFAEVPGSREVYNLRENRWEQRAEEESGRVALLAIAGRLGSVTKESRRPRQAIDLLARLSGKDWSTDVASQSPHTTLYRTSHLSSPTRWVRQGADPKMAGQYAQLVHQTQSRSAWLFAVRIPGRHDYLTALDDAVRQALAGDKTPSQALHDAAVRWQAITRQRDVEKQRQAHLHSLGLEP